MAPSVIEVLPTKFVKEFTFVGTFPDSRYLFLKGATNSEKHQDTAKLIFLLIGWEDNTDFFPPIKYYYKFCSQRINQSMTITESALI